MSKFTDDFAFTRGTGATRINEAGLIVGVDFSATSNTIGTGAKTFSLTADANVDRDWPVGSAVRVVDQVSANTMEGTVTTYTPSTQALVLDITSVTGSGTFTNWRIGSLEVRRDADGVLREPLRSNLIRFWKQATNAVWEKSEVTATANQALSITGSVDADLIAETSANSSHSLNTDTFSATVGLSYTLIALLKKGNGATAPDWVQLTFGNVGNAFGTAQYANFNLATGQIGNVAGGVADIVPQSNGYYLCIFTAVAIGTSGSNPRGNIVFTNNQNGALRYITTGFYAGQTTSNLFFGGAQIEQGASDTSIIPTTTVAVTRNADTFTFTPAAIAKFRQGQGALIIEANASDAGTAQRAALRLTGPSGEIRLGKQGVVTTSNFTKMAEGGDVQLLGNATQGVTSNGLEYGLFNPTRSDTSVALGATAVNAIAYNGSNEFAACLNQLELTSNSLLTTTDIKGLGASTLNGAHHNGSRFLIATGGAGVVGLSADGLSYRRVNTPVITQPCNEVTSGLVGATLRNVIVGNAGFIATSDDNGETWTARTSGTALIITGVTRSTTNFIIAIASATASANLRTSADGITWSAVANSNVSNNLLDVHANGATVVAVGAGGVITASLDNGATWTASTSSGVVTTQTLNGVHYNASANLWVAVGNAGTIITAVDPTGTWALQTSGTVTNLQEVTYFNGLWIATLNNNVVTSPNAVTWTVRSASVTATLNGIAASGTRLITVGTSGAFASSEDGLAYTSRTNNNATLNGIAYGAGVYVSVGNAVGGSGYIATIDGAGTVTRRVSGTGNNLSNINYLNGKFVANRSGAANIFLVSSDGSTWTSQGSGSGQQMNSTTFGAGIYVAVGSLGHYSTSADALSWSTASIASGITTQTLSSVEFANGVFVAVGNTGTIITGTYNGSVTWTARTSGTTQNLTSVMFSTRDQRWYAAGNAGTLLYSEDNGETWASVNNAGFGAVSNTTLQASKLLPQWKSGRNTMALSYKANEVIVGLNGVAVTDTSNSIPSITASVLGESFNGKIGPVYFYEFPKTLAEVIAITGVTR